MTTDRVIVRLFAVLRERAGTSEVPVVVGADSTVNDVLEQVFEKYPQLRPFDGFLRTAVNTKYVERGATVRDGDVVALISPVSGG